MMNFQRLFEETKNLNLLFVEDYEELRINSLEVLDNYFTYCEGAVDGRHGLEQYTAYHDKYQKHFDLVITDIKMPEMDGITLVKEIYKINELQPIIVLSAHHESEYLLTLINLGIEQFITKPIDHEEMLSVLYKVCKKINNKFIFNATKEKIYFSNNSYFDKETFGFYHEDVLMKLTKNELLFMRYGCTYIDKICTNEEIVNYFSYEGVSITNDNIRNLVAKLRKKLPINCIESIYATGYKVFVPFLDCE